MSASGVEPMHGCRGAWVRERLEPPTETEMPQLARAHDDRSIPELPTDAEDAPQARITAAYVIGHRLREQVAEINYLDPLVRRDAPDSVHRMRVTMRRLRSALATFRPMLDSQRTRASSRRAEDGSLVCLGQPATPRSSISD